MWAAADVLVVARAIQSFRLLLNCLYRRTGKCQEAQEHLTTATMMYRETGMTYWLEQAEAEMLHLA